MVRCGPDKRDKIIIGAGLIICVICVAYYYLKPYPLDYLPDGNLLVDPMKMLPDSFAGIGAVSTYGRTNRTPSPLSALQGQLAGGVNVLLSSGRGNTRCECNGKDPKCPQCGGTGYYNT